MPIELAKARGWPTRPLGGEGEVGGGGGGRGEEDIMMAKMGEKKMIKDMRKVTHGEEAREGGEGSCDAGYGDDDRALKLMTSS